MSFFRAGTRSIGLGTRALSLGGRALGWAVRGVQGAGTATRVAAGVAAETGVAAVTLTPAVERVTGKDLPFDEFVEDAATGAAANVGRLLGLTGGALQGAGTRGFGEGAAQTLLGVDGDDASGLVTVAILIIGALVAVQLVKG